MEVSMAKKTGPFRTTISVPADLKKRMDAATEQINWSAVACRAFEQRLAEIAASKEKKTMNDVIQRLRASLGRADDQTYKAGEKAGRIWAKGRAEVEELRNLERYRNRCGHEWDSLFVEETNCAYSRAELLFFEIHPKENGDRSACHHFWQPITDDDETTDIDQSAFLKGFAEGALDVWHEVKDKL
jgi:hypothetical protein